VANRDPDPRSPRPPRHPNGPPRQGRSGPPGFDGPRRGGPRDSFGPPSGGRSGPRDDRGPARKPPGKPPEIIHRDRDLLVVFKAAGQPTKGKPGLSVVSLVNDHLASRRERYRPVHELDDTASGVIALVPVNEDDDIRGPIRTSTTYLALVEGLFETGESAERAITGPVPGLKGKASAPVTSVRVIGTGNGLSLLRVRARPDAPGQVRAHLGSVQHPVVGDAEHGSHRDDVRRVALHAEEIRLRHPGTGMTERFRCPAPASFFKAIGTEPPANAGKDDAPGPQNLGWDQVAGWYDYLIASGGSDHHERTVIPGVERLLELLPGERCLDVACGQGILLDQLARRPDHGPLFGVDASPNLVQSAARTLGQHASIMVGDARDLPALSAAQDWAPFDAVACVLALMNIDDLAAVCSGLHAVLRPGGRVVISILHPAFRSPQTTAWGWTTDERTAVPVQFRRVDRYMSERASPIVMNPGRVAAGERPITTTTHHRPIAAYINALANAGLLVDAMEEWSSQRTSAPGPRAEAENIARAEIPMFLAIRARKPS